MTIFYVVRHGETDWNFQRRIQGHSDIPLNAQGRVQAKNLATQLVNIPFKAAYSSDLSRAKETAFYLTTHAIMTDVRLRERAWGVWEGKYFDEYFATHPTMRESIESEEQVRKRAYHFLEEIAPSHVGEHVLVVSHGGLIRTLVQPLVEPNVSIHCENTSYVELIFDEGKWLLGEIRGIKISYTETR